MHRNFGLTPKMPTDCLPTICPRVYRTGRTQMPFGHKEKTLLLNQLQCFEYSAEYFCDPRGVVYSGGIPLGFNEMTF